LRIFLATLLVLMVASAFFDAYTSRKKVEIVEETCGNRKKLILSALLSGLDKKINLATREFVKAPNFDNELKLRQAKLKKYQLQGTVKDVQKFLAR